MYQLTNKKSPARDRNLPIISDEKIQIVMLVLNKKKNWIYTNSRYKSVVIRSHPRFTLEKPGTGITFLSRSKTNQYDIRYND